MFQAPSLTLVKAFDNLLLVRQYMISLKSSLHTMSKWAQESRGVHPPNTLMMDEGNSSVSDCTSSAHGKLARMRSAFADRPVSY